MYNQTTIADKVKLNNKHNEKKVFIILDKFANWELAYLSANEAVSDHKVVTAFLYPTHRRLSQSNTNELIDKSTFRIELAFSNKNSP